MGKQEISLTELPATAIKTAISAELKRIYPTLEVYTENLPTTADNGGKPIDFPHFHVILLQTTSKQAPRLQHRDEWDIHKYFCTVKYRAMQGKTPRLATFTEELNTVGFTLLSNFKTLQLPNFRHKIKNAYTEIEPEQGVGIHILGFYFNVEVLLLIYNERAPLQQRLDYTIRTNTLPARPAGGPNVTANGESTGNERTNTAPNAPTRPTIATL
ncbi:MAG: hypothetical protein FWG64_13080 [Firmicutes bacterium]|nr:hypothetical protein [Bacillota bacterium]